MTDLFNINMAERKIAEKVAAAAAEEWEATLASIPKALKVLCDILSPEYTHPCIEKLRSFIIGGGFEKFTFPMVRAAWPSLFAQDLVTVQPMASQSAQIFYNNGPTTHSYKTGSKMKKENRQNNYIDKIQNYMKDRFILPEIKEMELWVTAKVDCWTVEQKNFFYSLLVRNPFKFTDDEIPINVQYCYLMNFALETYTKLKNSNYLKELNDNEIYCHLTAMEILNPFPIEDNLTDSSQRDKHIWYVLTQLMKYSMLGDINGAVSNV